MAGGCASPSRNDAGTPAADVRVYGPSQLARNQYESVRYLWVDTWRSAFWLPRAASEAAGIADLQAEAARLGANGLINVACIDQRQTAAGISSNPSFVCYGHAIRVRSA